MKAMVLAAGLGTRLRPLTNDRPKALVEVAGRTMLEMTLSRLRAFGVQDVIVNVHHFADMVIDYLRAHNNFEMHIEVSREDALLDTGGGLKKAAWFFQDGGAASDEPFLVHNVDILSSFNFTEMLAAHRQTGALATLAVQKRETSRLLLFDHDLQLRGRALSGTTSDANMTPLAFAGIHVVSPKLLSMLGDKDAFSIIDTYIRVASEQQRIVGHREDAAYWCDLGKPANIVSAEVALKRHPQLSA